MKKKLLAMLSIVFSGLLILGGCGTAQGVNAMEFEVIEAQVTSERDTEIPTTLVKPKDTKGNIPLVIFAHGFNGGRDEAGGFTRVAEGLAQRGIASVRFDFAGNNESTDDFEQLNFTTTSQDYASVLAYAKTEVAVDEARIGTLGYSMGGRVVSQELSNHNMKSVVLWAPATASMTLGGEEQMAAMVTQANNEGAADFEFFGNMLSVSKEFLDGTKSTKPLENIRAYTGDLLVITGGADDVVTKDGTDLVVKSATKTNITTHMDVPRATHALGFYDDDAAVSKVIVDTTVNFFYDNL